MDFKEYLPFLVVLAISVIGSIFKKKSAKGEKSTGKSMIEKFLDEVNGKNTTEVFEEPEPAVVGWENEADEDDFEYLSTTENQENLKEETTKQKPVSLLDHFAESREKNKDKAFGKLKVIELSDELSYNDFSLENAEDARKAIIYAEIIKPRYF